MKSNSVQLHLQWCYYSCYGTICLLRGFLKVRYVCFLTCMNIFVITLQRNVYKHPVTDTGKKSKKGRLTLQEENGKIVTVEEGKGDPHKVREKTVKFVCLSVFVYIVQLQTIAKFGYCIRHIFRESNFSRIGTSRHFREWLISQSRRAMDAEISTHHSLIFRRQN